MQPLTKKLQKSVVATLLALLSAGLLHAADCTWTGSVDTTYSNPDNWTPALPQAGDTAIFDNASSVDCVIDTDVQVGAITIKKDYAGTVYGRSAVITLDHAHFSALHGHFNAEQSTIRFIGNGYQRLDVKGSLQLNTVENAKQGNRLRFAYDRFKINTLIASPGTTTELPPCGRQVYVDHIQFVGEADNPVIVRTYKDGSCCRLILDTGGTQQIANAQIKDIDALGAALDASDNCTNLGGNTDVFFDGTKLWNGGAADGSTAWSNPENWVANRVPVDGDKVFFDEATTRNCVLDTDITLAQLKLDGYTGTLNFKDRTVTFTGDYKHVERGGDVRNGNIVFAGSTTQYLLSSYDKPSFNTVTLSNTTAALVIKKYPFSCNTLTLDPGTHLRVADHNGAVKAADFLSNGTAQAPVIVEAWLENDIFDLKVTNSATAQYTLVSACNAASGVTIDATDNCADDGNNTNWNFGTDENDLIRADFDFPATSRISPAYLEGDYRWFADDAAVTVQAHGDPTAGTPITQSRFFANATLDPAGAPTTVHVTFNNNPDATSIGEITWIPTDIAQTHTMLLRQGDSLLLTATGPGALLEIDPDYDSAGQFTPAYTGVPGDTWLRTFDTPGEYWVASRIDNAEPSYMRVTVAAVDLNGPIACQIGWTRTKDVTISGATPDQVSFSSADHTILAVTEANTTDNGKQLTLRPGKPGTPGLIARLEDPQQRIIAYAPVDEFTVDLLRTNALQLIELLPDDAMILEGDFTITPHIPNLQVTYRAHSGGLTLVDLTRSRTVNTDSYTLQGISSFGTYQLIWQGVTSPSPCTSAIVFQNNVQISK